MDWPVTSEPSRAKARPLRPRRSYFAPADAAPQSALTVGPTSPPKPSGSGQFPSGRPRGDEREPRKRAASVEAPGTAPGSDRFISTHVYRHIRPLRGGTRNIGPAALTRKGGFPLVPADSPELRSSPHPGPSFGGLEHKLRRDPAFGPGNWRPAFAEMSGVCGISQRSAGPVVRVRVHPFPFPAFRRRQWSAGRRQGRLTDAPWRTAIGGPPHAIDGGVRPPCGEGGASRRSTSQCRACPILATQPMPGLPGIGHGSRAALSAARPLRPPRRVMTAAARAQQEYDY